MFQKCEYKKTIYIKGMSCAHCVKRVKDTLSSLKGVRVQVVLEEGIASIESKTELKDDELQDMIEELGYEVIKIQ